MKRCKECGELKQFSEFYKHKENKDGLRGKCKSCWCKNTSKYQSDNKGKYNEYSRKYYHSEKGKEYTKRYRQSKACKITQKSNSEKTRKKYPIKYKAGQKLHEHVRFGKIHKPETCSLCGVNLDRSKIHGHHWSYLEDHWLDVVWCCSQCHSDIHNDKPQDILRRQNSVVLNHINSNLGVN